MEYARNMLWRSEIQGGMATVVVGILAAIEASQYGFGTISRIGPGFLPLVYSALLVGLGLAIAASGFTDRTRVTASRIRPLLMITAAILAWTFLAPRAGFVVATICLVLIAGMAERRVKYAELCLISIAAVIMGSLIIVSFNVPLHIWPWS